MIKCLILNYIVAVEICSDVKVYLHAALNVLCMHDEYIMKVL